MITVEQLMVQTALNQCSLRQFQEFIQLCCYLIGKGPEVFSLHDMKHFSVNFMKSNLFLKFNIASLVSKSKTKNKPFRIWYYLKPTVFRRRKRPALN